MRVFSEPSEWRVVIHMDQDAEEASYVYDLVASGRLEVENKEHLPLPFRGAFGFKVPARPRPVDIQVGRFESTAGEIQAGGPRLKFLVACPRTSPELLLELEAAMRDVPPASEEEFKGDSPDRMDEFGKIRKMNFAQRVIYATRAGQSGRQMIMQQPTALLLLYLCKNPLITLPEIIAIAKLPSIDALVAEYIVKMLRANPQWGMSEELKLALVMNAKTPGGTGLSLLRHLSSRSLRKVAGSEVHSTVKNGALKVLGDRRD
jgi:hypothetical protein